MMDTKVLKQIIENHKHWLNEDVEGWENMRADLSGANLIGANLRHTNLSGADLSGADLIGADLWNANLSGADLIGANLWNADLRFANLGDVNLCGASLRYTNLIGANLSGANLIGANLWNVNLRYTNLSGANLCGANLRGADLRGANLSRANLVGANLWNADLRKAKNVPYIPMICPKEGSFIGYKKASDKIIKLCIPKDAKRSSATTRNCRCDRATVLAIYELDGSISKVDEVASSMDSNFIYKINKEVVVDDFDTDRWNECSTGIHFFMQRQEAIDYQG